MDELLQRVVMYESEHGGGKRPMQAAGISCYDNLHYKFGASGEIIHNIEAWEKDSMT